MDSVRMLEAILPCWEWFWNIDHEVKQCGFLMTGKLQRNGYPCVSTRWVESLFERLNCTRVSIDETDTVLEDDELQWANFTFRETQESDSFEALTSFRNRVYSGENISENRNSSILHVGVLMGEDMGNHRLFSSGLTKQLQQDIGKVKIQISTADFETTAIGHVAPSFSKQVEWFTQQDAIVSLQSSALSNCIFMKEGPIVIHGYPGSRDSIERQPYTTLIRHIGGNNVYIDKLPLLLGSNEVDMLSKNVSSLLTKAMTSLT